MEQKPLKFLPHARHQMALRGISEAEVRAVIADYETRSMDYKGNARFFGTVNGRRLRVIVDFRTNPAEVITAADRDT